VKVNILVVIALLVGSCSLSKRVANSENRDADSLIAASQAGAMPVFFNPSDPGIADISSGKFNDTSECHIRGGLPNFFYKANHEKAITIGYIGGSITRGKNMYRDQSAKFIQKMFPNVKMNAINAGVAGTGTDLGACRIREQLLRYHPALIFIEFAVNGAFRPGMEGMVRQIRAFDPSIDICFLYTITDKQGVVYAAGKVPENIQGLEAIADHYGIPSIHMGLYPSLLAQKGALIWKGDAAPGKGKIIFSNDGIHPLPAGGDLYAAAIARAMIKMSENGGITRHTMPLPLIADNWQDAAMVAPQDVATFSKGWTAIDPDRVDSLRSLKPWFPVIMKSDRPGSFFSFRFRGNMVGLFDIGGPESGVLVLQVDGKKIKELYRFNRYCNNRYRGQCVFVPLSAGEHTVRFILSADKLDKAKILSPSQLSDLHEHPERYDQTAELLGKILIRGKILDQ
jgi:lysophospholipase L1-like esterase